MIQRWTHQQIGRVLPLNLNKIAAYNGYKLIFTILNPHFATVLSKQTLGCK